MRTRTATPWHKASYDRFLNEGLPSLLAERLPLTGYRVTPVDTHTCHITVALTGQDDEVEVEFEGIPQPDADGVFEIGGEARIVVPVATSDDLAEAQILCVGELLLATIEARLGKAPADLPWDEDLARAWLPLDAWIAAFMDADGAGRFTPPQRLEASNWLASVTHRRRLILAVRSRTAGPERTAGPRSVIHPMESGRVCPFEMPEGPNLGHIFTIALGAEIRDGKLVTVDDHPEATLGISASLIPFIEHDDPNRILMGANMLRQWVPQARPEPALVQTGNEPGGGEVWTGRNLLTAFVSWGPGTYEDGIVVSESCARRFDSPYPLQVGDKMSNRHGIKGVVSQILPDAAMPHLVDGTPVDLAFSFTALHTRMTFGQIREAVLGRIAHQAGEPAVVPPFAAPSEADLRERLAEAGLPESGMEALTMGRGGPALEQPSTVGYVYWGRLWHLAKSQLRTFVAGEWGQVLGEMETYTLRDIGAFEVAQEALNTRAVRNPNTVTLRDRAAAGSVTRDEPPTPVFRDLALRLRAGGIATELEGEKLRFRFAPATEGGLALAGPVPHPWLRERMLTTIATPTPLAGGEWDDLWALLAPPGGWHGRDTLPAHFRDVVEANKRAARLLSGQAPARLADEAVAELTRRVQAFFSALLTPAHLRLSERQQFSGRTVLIPATDLTLAQLGVPETMAWDLFGPLAARELGGDAEAEAATAARTDEATVALDAVMARGWIILNRAPTLAATAMLAFHPVRVPGDALHLHPLLCEWLNADFDGDQAAVHVPVTEAAQREAGEKLSVAGHLRREPELLASLLPRLDSLWGLAELGRRPDGLDELAELIGTGVAAAQGFVTRGALAEALRGMLKREGVEATVTRLETLAAKGFEVAKASGASLAPFPTAATLISPAPPAGTSGTGDATPAGTAEAWETYTAEVIEALAAPTDCVPASLGPQCLMARASGHGFQQLAWLLAGRGTVTDAAGHSVLVRHGYAEGYTPEEMFASVREAREGLAQIIWQWEEMGRTFRTRNIALSFHPLARALRSATPGVVFARAAALGEVDPLVDVEARLLVGLPVE
jgi:hypothetical protein